MCIFTRKLQQIIDACLLIMAGGVLPHVCLYGAAPQQEVSAHADAQSRKLRLAMAGLHFMKAPSSNMHAAYSTCLSCRCVGQRPPSLLITFALMSAAAVCYTHMVSVLPGCQLAQHCKSSGVHHQLPFYFYATRDSTVTLSLLN